MGEDPYEPSEVADPVPGMQVDVPPPPTGEEVIPQPLEATVLPPDAPHPQLIGTDEQGQPVYGYPAPRQPRFPGLGRFLLAASVGIAGTLILQAAAGASRERGRYDDRDRDDDRD